MIIGIQGQAGSACDEAAAKLFPSTAESFVYLTDAEQTLEALSNGVVDAAVLAAESPVGVPVPETATALEKYAGVGAVQELRQEVHHCVLVHSDYTAGPIRNIASHQIPLTKHASYLQDRFPGYQALMVSDPGVAAQRLAAGDFGLDTAVIAMPRAAELFGLKILEPQLPANDDYLTRFVVVQLKSVAPKVTADATPKRRAS